MAEFMVWFESKRGMQHIVCLTAPDYFAAIHMAKQTILDAGFKHVRFMAYIEELKHKHGLRTERQADLFAKHLLKGVNV